MKQEYSAGVVVFRQEDDQPLFLLLHYQAGHWDFPKGHIEKSESKQEAALRELQEETGLQAEIWNDFQETIEYFFRYPEQKGLVRKTVYFFIAKASFAEVRLSHEHVGFDWLPYKQALKKLTYKNAQDILKKAYKRITQY